MIALGVAALLVVVFLASGEGEAGPAPLNGSLQYAPAMGALAVFAILTWRRGHVLRHWALAAAGVFALSLVFRTVDLAVCAAFPTGSHFMWHVLNGAMVAILLQMLVRAPAVGRMRA
ncbi:hypothetical protein SAMN05216227_101288 [Pseudorhodobacter antarcticus]|uniref:Ceramidase n=1 Tax=Pseudorhodobacter antarcticus TaxID=1077947 RepID=A0A1H8G349_9RHOB|nr:hypothetical protein SAMN05216227_101288 [Pseudorhodobacter antarcticus]